MSKDTFLLMSLKEDEAKKLAKVIGNDTSRKILDYLGEKEFATETNISKDLGVPISTVHYNIQALVEAKLIEAEEYHYSQKGKEIIHYKIANKIIIIAPKSTWGLRDKLKKILPVALISTVGAGIVTLLNIKNQFGVFDVEMSGTQAKMIVAEAAPVVQQNMSNYQEMALWFLIGSLSALVLYLLIDYLWFKFKN